MSYFVISLITVLLLFALIYYRTSDVIYFRSKIDNNLYALRDSTQKPEKFLQNSADTLGEINARVNMLIKNILTKYKNNPNYSFVRKLNENYNYSMISEAPHDNNFTSYTIDKSRIYLCIRSRDDYESLYNINLLMYVVIHELAHLCNYTSTGVPIEGHGMEFQQKFKFLATEAINLGVYKYHNYAESPEEYCGMIINSSIV